MRKVYARTGILDAERFKKLRDTCLKNNSIGTVKKKSLVEDRQEMDVDELEDTDNEEDSDMDEEMSEATDNQEQKME